MCLAQRTLGWRATRDLDEICRDAWKWQTNSFGPDGEQAQAVVCAGSKTEQAIAARIAPRHSALP
jgi:hypothetical protein